MDYGNTRSIYDLATGHATEEELEEVKQTLGGQQLISAPGHHV